MLSRAQHTEQVFDQMAHNTSQNLQASVADKPLSSEITPASSRLDFLLVEDNPINLKLLVKFCTKHNFQNRSATDGLYALEAYKDAMCKPDIIIMDISMPRMDGLESTRAIRAFERENHLKRSHIVALTAVVSSEASDKAHAAGCDLFIPKPASFAKLLQVAEEWRNGQRAT